jgi:hypothetical protein
MKAMTAGSQISASEQDLDAAQRIELDVDDLRLRVAAGCVLPGGEVL